MGKRKRVEAESDDEGNPPEPRIVSTDQASDGEKTKKKKKKKKDKEKREKPVDAEKAKKKKKNLKIQASEHEAEEAADSVADERKSSPSPQARSESLAKS